MWKPSIDPQRAAHLVPKRAHLFSIYVEQSDGDLPTKVNPTASSNKPHALIKFDHCAMWIGLLPASEVDARLMVRFHAALVSTAGLMFRDAFRTIEI